MSRRRGSENTVSHRADRVEEATGSHGANTLWLGSFMGWSEEASAKAWPGPKPEMIAAALFISENAALRARGATVVSGKP